MLETHIVQPAGHLSGLAAQHGFRSFRALFEHPDNAALRKKRPNPSVLLRGSIVVIPDSTTGQENGISTALRVGGYRCR